jgi:hypothetical protein
LRKVTFQILKLRSRTGKSVLSSDAIAFFARDAKMITMIELTWKDGDQNIFGNKQWLDEFNLIMEAFTSKYSYVDFIDIG